MSHTKFAMLDAIVRNDMRKEFASIRNEYALYHRELESHPPKRKLSTKDKIILDFLKENECGDLIFTPLPKSSSQVINYNKESGKFSFDITSNIHGAGQFPFFESLDHILLPYLLESVNQYLVWCEDDEIIHLDESGNPTDDMSLDSKEFNEIMVCTDLTDMLQNHFQTQQKSNPKGFPNP